MPKSTINLTQSGIPVLNPDGTSTGIYLYLDCVKDNGIMYIITRWNFKEEPRTNEFDNTTYTMYTYNEAWIKTWSLPGFYIKDGAIIQLGTTDSSGKHEVTREQVIDYITVNAAEIAGFAQTSKLKYVG
jgi:hypothetical protein